MDAACFVSVPLDARLGACPTLPDRRDASPPPMWVSFWRALIAVFRGEILAAGGAVFARRSAVQCVFAEEVFGWSCRWHNDLSNGVSRRLQIHIQIESDGRERGDCQKGLHSSNSTQGRARLLHLAKCARQC